MSEANHDVEGFNCARRVADCPSFLSWGENGENFIDCREGKMDEDGRCRCREAMFIMGEGWLDGAIDALQRAKDRMG